MSDPTFDKDGYPTDETCDRIEKWPIEDGLRNLFEFVVAAWSDYGIVKRRGRTYRFITGGWSGNESLVGALEGNRMAYMLCWEMSRRGGLHVYVLPKLIP